MNLTQSVRFFSFPSLCSRFFFSCILCTLISFFSFLPSTPCKNHWVSSSQFPPFCSSSLYSSLSHPLCLSRSGLFYRISLRSSPLSLMCSIKDASLKHTHTHTQDQRWKRIGKRKSVEKADKGETLC